MKRVTVVRLEAVEREDGNVYVSCPELPLFHVVAPKDTAHEAALNMLRDYLKMNSRRDVSLRAAEGVDSFLDDGRPPCIVPPHVIAEMAA